MSINQGESINIGSSVRYGTLDSVGDSSIVVPALITGGGATPGESLTLQDGTNLTLQDTTDLTAQ